MLYTRNEVRYTENQLRKMGVTDPLKSGFNVLKNIVPEYDRFTQKVVDSGDTLDGAIVYTVEELTDTELATVIASHTKDILAAVDSRIDKTIITIKGYDNRDAIGKYLVPGTMFYDECKAMSEWISACYVYCYQLQMQVAAGEIELPSVTEAIAGLPVPTFLSESELATLNKTNSFNNIDGMFLGYM